MVDVAAEELQKVRDMLSDADTIRDAAVRTKRSSTGSITPVATLHRPYCTDEGSNRRPIKECSRCSVKRSSYRAMLLPKTDEF